MSAVEATGEDTLVRVRVQPKASREAVMLTEEGGIRVALTAPPVEGKANKALIAYLAKVLDVPRRTISLERGEKSREKVLRIAGVAAAVVRERVCSAAAE